MIVRASTSCRRGYPLHAYVENHSKSAIRIEAEAEADGELHLRGLPIQKGQKAQVIVITNGEDGPSDDAVLALLRHDPSWAWLHDPAEDVYTEEDVR